MIELKQILHPTDFSANSTRALEYACSLAGRYGAELHLVHVLQDPDYYEHLSKHANEELAALPDKVSSFSGSVTRDVCTGVPFVEIIRYAKENAIDLVVMGTHGYSGMKHLIIGSVAENVVRKAHCPVLTVHPENYEFVMP
jgi:nucleotide-binding universal stress UspA family protein